MRKFRDFFNTIIQKIKKPFIKKKNEKAFIQNDIDNGDEASTTIIFDDKDALQIQERIKKNVKKDPEIPESELHAKTRSFSSSFKKKESRPSFIVGLIITTAKVAIIAVIIIGVACLGAVFGVANAYLGTTPELSLAELQDNDLTSYIYDCNGDLITSYVGVENRDYATLSEIPELLQEAFISIEDVRFYHHNGIDLKRIAKAFISNFSGSDRVSGGSTITQQLIKNQLLSSERSYKRKIQEASLAIELEKKYSKEQILEAYLNSIPLGGVNYGVKAAAKDYFGKELNELSLRETACLAGITQSPYSYNPRRCYFGSDDPDVTKTRVDALNTRIDLVLKAMYEAGYISLEEYNSALAEKLSVMQKSTVSELYKYTHFVEYAIDNITDAFLEYRGLEDTEINRQAIKNELCTKGYSIYTTVDPEIQTVLEETAVEYVYPKMAESGDSTIIKQINGADVEVVQPQAAAVIIDQSTGYVKAMIGSRTPPTIKKSTNLAVENFSMVGSAIKPLTVYGPALDSGLGLGTTIENIKVPIDGWDTETGYPTTSHGQKTVGYGPVSIRNGIKYSLNIVAARTLMNYVGVGKANDYLSKLIIDESEINKDPIGMTLGTSGISTLDMTAAYACIANGGVYNEPIAFTEITDRYGQSVLKAADVQDSYKVYEPSTAYMLVSAMTDAVNGGTGTKAKIDGITVAGKTGTNAKNKGVFFAGMTGYYTSTVWIGHEYYKSLENTSGGSGAAPLWQAYMSEILEGKSDKPILEGSMSQYGVAEYSVCSVSGMLATEECESDLSGHYPVTELYPISTEMKSCNMHQSLSVCAISGMNATRYCPTYSYIGGSAVVISDDSDYCKLPQNELLDIFGTVIIGSGIYEDAVTGESFYNSRILLSRDIYGNITSSDFTVCSIHDYEWHLNNGEMIEEIIFAQSVIDRYNTFINSYSSYLTDDEITELKEYYDNLVEAMNSDDSSYIINTANALDAMIDVYEELIY